MAARGGIFGGVTVVVESDGSDVVPVTLCHSPATYIAEKNTTERENNVKSVFNKVLFFNILGLFISLYFSEC